jgi:hypothetical protein
MTLPLETISDAREVARAAVAYLGEEERWALLQKWLAKETAGKREASRRSLRLEALRSIVCPRVTDREWDQAVRARGPGRRTNGIRLANALAIQRAGGPGPVDHESDSGAQASEPSHEHSRTRGISNRGRTDTRRGNRSI